jgi:acetylserotonin N-methyltransferase
MRYELPASEDRAIWDIWLSMHHLPAMAVADELGIYGALDPSPASAAELAERLNLNRRGTGVLLGMLAALGLVALRAGRYELEAAARTYLLSSSAYYWGPLLRALGVVAQPHAALIAALRAPNEVASSVQTKPATIAGDPVEGWQSGQIDRAQAEAVTQIMHCHSLPASVAVARSGVLQGVSRLLDVGGGSGCFSIALAQHFPSIRCTVMELAAVCEVAKRYIADGGVPERVDTAAVDMFREPWPRGYDGMFFSNIFHDWDAETDLFLAERAYDALADGGRIFLHEMLLAEDGSGPLTTASFSMLMLLGTKGRQYTLDELRQILASAGFVDIEARKTYGYYSVVSGRKR